MVYWSVIIPAFTCYTCYTCTLYPCTACRSLTGLFCVCRVYSRNQAYSDRDKQTGSAVQWEKDQLQASPRNVCGSLFLCVCQGSSCLSRIKSNSVIKVTSKIIYLHMYYVHVFLHNGKNNGENQRILWIEEIIMFLIKQFESLL